MTVTMVSVEGVKGTPAAEDGSLTILLEDIFNFLV